MKVIAATTDINASAERVWEILTDFAAYPQWNPFVKYIGGDLRRGAKLDVFIQPAGGRGMRFRPTVLACEPGRELRWLGSVIVRGLFDGEHRFLIEPLPESRVRFMQSERFTGLLVPLMARSLDAGTARGFELMNQALKARAEG